MNSWGRRTRSSTAAPTPGDQSALKAISEFDKAYRDHWGIA
jgi:hypothetical protein